MEVIERSKSAIWWIPAMVLFVSGCLVQAETAAPSASPAAAASSAPLPESIGAATMLEDGTIEMQLRAEDGSGGIGEASFTYTKDDPRYPKILEHLGGLKPGESKSVPPWP